MSAECAKLSKYMYIGTIIYHDTKQLKLPEGILQVSMSYGGRDLSFLPKSVRLLFVKCYTDVVDKFPADLYRLNVSCGWKLRLLCNLPKKLMSLECEGVKLCTLPAIPATVYILHCCNNMLSYIPLLAMSCPAGGEDRGELYLLAAPKIVSGDIACCQNWRGFLNCYDNVLGTGVGLCSALYVRWSEDAGDASGLF